MMQKELNVGPTCGRQTLRVATEVVEMRAEFVRPADEATVKAWTRIVEELARRVELLSKVVDLNS